MTLKRFFEPDVNSAKSKDGLEEQGPTAWNGNYNKFLVQPLFLPETDPSRSITLDRISLIKLGNLLLKCTVIIGTKTSRCTKRCNELVVLSGVDGESS
jgi:hypothetical protein